MPCRKVGQHRAAAVGWPQRWAGQLSTHAQLKAEAQVRELEEELRIEQDMKVSTAVCIRAGRQGGKSKITSWKASCVICRTRRVPTAGEQGPEACDQSLVGMLRSGFPEKVKRVKRRVL